MRVTQTSTESPSATTPTIEEVQKLQAEFLSLCISRVGRPGLISQVDLREEDAALTKWWKLASDEKRLEHYELIKNALELRKYKQNSDL